MGKFFSRKFLDRLQTKVDERYGFDIVEMMLEKGVDFDVIIKDLACSFNLEPEYEEGIGHPLMKRAASFCKFMEFDSIDPNMKRRLVELMARIMERAYRRGVQQALVMNEGNQILPYILNDLYSYRYEIDLDFSPGLDGYKTTSKERLFMEEKLENLGFSK